MAASRSWSPPRVCSSATVRRTEAASGSPSKAARTLCARMLSWRGTVADGQQSLLQSSIEYLIGEFGAKTGASVGRGAYASFATSSPLCLEAKREAGSACGPRAGSLFRTCRSSLASTANRFCSAPPSPRRCSLAACLRRRLHAPSRIVPSRPFLSLDRLPSEVPSRSTTISSGSNVDNRVNDTGNANNPGSCDLPPYRGRQRLHPSLQ